MSIIINGSPSKPFKMERGLRQGDPLSPFLFVLIAEVLNRLINITMLEGLVDAIKVGSDGIILSHMQFAVDTILFSPAKKEVLMNLRRILDCYGFMSGLRINYEKYALFPLNCESSLIQELNAALGCMISSLPTKYLGIPLGPNPRRIETWSPIIDKIRRKFSGWKSKL